MALISLFFTMSIAVVLVDDCRLGDLGPFANLVGAWEVTASDRIAPGRFEETTGRSTIVAGLGGCALIERYEGTRGGAPYSMVVVTRGTGP